jgi:hypothetical protein
LSVAENRDANDVFQQDGAEAIRAAIAGARDTLPPFAPYEEEDGAQSAAIFAKPFAWRPTAEIPARQWLYGRHLIRKFVSLDIAPGGVGKSSIKVVEALAMTSGQALLHKEIHEGPHRVWFYNLEDPDEETERRIHAAAQHYKLSPDDLGGRLFVNSGREQPLVIATETPNGTRIVRPVVEAIIAAIKANRIDVLTVDPFVSSHSVSENDNGAIDMVAKEWAFIADVCNCSINLVHHVRKTNGAEVTAESSRGAVSLIGAARSVIVYNRMTKPEAEAAGIDPKLAGFHFRMQNDKANLAPAEGADWFRMNNVDLVNGDSVGVAGPWRFPDAFDDVQVWHVKRVQHLVGNGEYRADVRAKEWVGNLISEVLEIDPRKQRDKVKKIIKQWLETDVLRLVIREDKHRNEREFVEVGIWQTD